MGILENLGLSGLGNSLSGLGNTISTFRDNVDDQTGGLLTRLGEPENQADLVAAASLLSGEGIPASFALRNQVRSNLLANQQFKRQREGIEALKKRYANNPQIISLLDTNPSGVISALTTQAFAPTKQVIPQSAIGKIMQDFNRGLITEEQKNLLIQNLQTKTGSEKPPQTYKDPSTGQLKYLSNPPFGKKINDLVQESDLERSPLTDTQLNQAAKLRTDLSKELKEFKDVERSFNNIQQFFDSPGSVSDQALATAFAKVLDPGTAAREGEVAVIVGAGALSGQLKTTLQNAIKGDGKLDPRTRTEIRNLAAQIYNTTAEKAIEDINTYTKLAQNQSTNPNFLEAVITSNVAPQLITEFYPLPSPLGGGGNNNNATNQINLEAMTLQEFEQFKTKVKENPAQYQGTNMFKRIMDENKRRGIK